MPTGSALVMEWLNLVDKVATCPGVYMVVVTMETIINTLSVSFKQLSGRLQVILTVILLEWMDQ